MRYELLYSEGGHGGPYSHMETALEEAQKRALGLPHSNHIDIHERLNRPFSHETRKFRVSVSRTKDTVSLHYWDGVEFAKIWSRPLDLPSESGYTGAGSVDLSEFTPEDKAM